MDAASLHELRIYLVLFAIVAVAYVGGWFISLWYNNYPYNMKRRGKHLGRTRKKARR